MRWQAWYASPVVVNVDGSSPSARRRPEISAARRVMIEAIRVDVGDEVAPKV